MGISDSSLTTRSTQTRARRTHSQRREDTRRRLCVATLEVLSEFGYEKTTTALIAARAAMSKGAQTHHFPSKVDMLAGAFEHLVAEWRAKSNALLRRCGGIASIEQVIEFLWAEIFSQPDYRASLELVLASQHDADLRDKIAEGLFIWAATLNSLMPKPSLKGNDQGKSSALFQLTTAVLAGLAAAQSFGNSGLDSSYVLALLTSIAQRCSLSS